MSGRGSSSAAAGIERSPVPRGRGGSRSRLRGLPPQAVAADQRRRIVAALGEAIAARGYTGTTVERVIAPAGVSRRTFYELFSSKADAFWAAHGEALELLDGRVRGACEAEAEWPRKVAAAIAAALEWAAANPARAHLICAEPNLAYCHDLLVERFGPGLRQGRVATGVDLPPIQEEVLVGGVAAVVAARLGDRRPASLPDLAPPLTEFVLAPYLDEHAPHRSVIR